MKSRLLSEILESPSPLTPTSARGPERRARASRSRDMRGSCSMLEGTSLGEHDYSTVELRYWAIRVGVTPAPLEVLNLRHKMG